VFPFSACEEDGAEEHQGHVEEKVQALAKPASMEGDHDPWEVNPW